MRYTIVKLFLVALALGLMACQQQAPAEDPVARGKYLTIVGGCHDCHTPKNFGAGGMPEPNMALQLSGHPQDLPYPEWTPADMQRHALALGNPMLTAWAGPWGVSFASNLTPDVETGIGEWTEENFIQAMRTGKHQGQPNGRDILPPMPWQTIKEMTDADLKALWAYFRSVPAIKNQVPFPVPPSAPPEQ
jgi:cytochrome c553